MMSHAGLRGIRFGAVLASALAASSAAAQQLELEHVNRVFLTDIFNSNTDFGTNALSVAFDGENAFVSGFNNAAADGSVGIVQVSDLFGAFGSAAINGLPATTTPVTAFRGIESLDYDPVTGSLISGQDNGTNTVVTRYNSGLTGAVWQVAVGRPASGVAVDPTGVSDGPGVAFATQGSGRRQLLDMADGSVVFDSTNGAIINADPDFFGTAWRSIDFDTQGNVVLTENSGVQYGERVNDNRFQTLAGTLDRTTSSARADGEVNNIGQGSVILEGMGPGGSDLLAFSVRNSTQVTDLDGAVTAIDTNQVQVRNLDGSTDGLSQVALAGDESGLALPWDADVKDLAFGVDADSGLPVLLVVDLASNRLDVYRAVPEPASLALLGLGAAGLLGRRRA